MALQCKMQVASARAVSRRAVVVCRAQAQETTSRRALLGLVGAASAALASAMAVPQAANAIGLPWQESTGGLGKGGGNSPKSPTRASMESYTLEGTKKQGITPKKKAALLAKARARAEGAK